MPLAELLDALDYNQSLFYLKTEHKREPEVASLFRAARDAGDPPSVLKRTPQTCSLNQTTHLATTKNSAASRQRVPRLLCE